MFRSLHLNVFVRTAKFEGVLPPDLREVVGGVVRILVKSLRLIASSEMKSLRAIGGTDCSRRGGVDDSEVPGPVTNPARKRTVGSVGSPEMPAFRV